MFLKFKFQKLLQLLLAIDEIHTIAHFNIVSVTFEDLFRFVGVPGRFFKYQPFSGNLHVPWWCGELRLFCFHDLFYLLFNAIMSHKSPNRFAGRPWTKGVFGWTIAPGLISLPNVPGIIYIDRSADQ